AVALSRRSPWLLRGDDGPERSRGVVQSDTREGHSASARVAGGWVPEAHVQWSPRHGDGRGRALKRWSGPRAGELGQADARAPRDRSKVRQDGVNSVGTEQLAEAFSRVYTARHSNRANSNSLPTAAHRPFRCKSIASSGPGPRRSVPPPT